MGRKNENARNVPGPASNGWWSRVLARLAGPIPGSESDRAPVVSVTAGPFIGHAAVYTDIVRPPGTSAAPAPTLAARPAPPAGARTYEPVSYTFAQDLAPAIPVHEALESVGYTPISPSEPHAIAVNWLGEVVTGSAALAVLFNRNGTPK